MTFHVAPLNGDGMPSDVFTRAQLTAILNALEPVSANSDFNRGWLEAMQRIGTACGIAHTPNQTRLEIEVLHD